MNEPNPNKITIRPKLPNVIINDTMTLEEQFQNRTLRPILKMQHDLIVRMIEMYIKKKKNVYHNLTAEKKADYIKNNLLADRVIAHELRGLILGMFTLSEMDFYLQYRLALHKRIHNLLYERIKSAF